MPAEIVPSASKPLRMSSRWRRIVRLRIAEDVPIK